MPRRVTPRLYVTELRCHFALAAPAVRHRTEIVSAAAHTLQTRTTVRSAGSLDRRTGETRMIRIQMHRARGPGLSAVLLSVAGALLFTACASSPPAPEVAMSAARQAIAVADQAHITGAASPALAEARSKLDEAGAAVKAQHMVQAERLAQESRVDAELAVTQSNAAKDQAVNDDMLRSTDTLSEEMKRNAGATP
jgi:Domain of unknown function (DUF4398)